MRRVAGYLSLLAAVVLFTSCSGSSSSRHTSTSATSSPSSPPVSTVPTTFTSKNYGYTLTVPARWRSLQAFFTWDGQMGLDGASPYVDIFGQPKISRGMFAAAAPWKQSLAQYATSLIAFNRVFHGDTCPQTPDSRSSVTVGGEPGVLLAYNCGILINNVGTVHNGVGYLFVFVDRRVAAATNPADRATFLKILKSVKFPT